MTLTTLRADIAADNLPSDPLDEDALLAAVDAFDNHYDAEVRTGGVQWTDNLVAAMEAAIRAFLKARPA